MLKIKRKNNQQDFKIGDLHFVKSEKISLIFTQIQVDTNSHLIIWRLKG